MKRKWKTFVKDYLTFSRRDRLGMLFIFLALITLSFAGYFFKRKPVVHNYDAFQQELASLKISIDSSPSYSRRKYDEDDNDYTHYTPAADFKKEATFKGDLFYFDPNTLDAAGWKRLGVKEKTVGTILKFVGKGYTFRNAEDIKKIYGLKPAEAERLIPFIKIEPKETPARNGFPSEANRENFTARPVTAASRIIEINEGDSSAFISLPGIGSKLAFRIISFRDKLGGFVSVNQLAEVYALQDSTFQKIKNRLVCKNGGVKTIDINTADANLLKSHPYIKWNIANAIVAYRLQHGLYKSVDDLKKINIIDDTMFEKMKPYLVASQ